MVTWFLSLLGIEVDVLTREEAAAFILQREVRVTYRPLIIEHNQERDTKGDDDAA